MNFLRDFSLDDRFLSFSCMLCVCRKVMHLTAILKPSITLRVSIVHTDTPKHSLILTNL